jgi:hypothetical protein
LGIPLLSISKKAGFKKTGRNLRSPKEKPDPSNDLSRGKKPIFGHYFE